MAYDSRLPPPPGLPPRSRAVYDRRVAIRQVQKQLNIRWSLFASDIAVIQREDFDASPKGAAWRAARVARRAALRLIVETSGEGSPHDLAKRFGVSVGTIEGDLLLIAQEAKK